MYVCLWGVTFMSDCEVTLRPSGAFLVWALNVRLVFLFVSVLGSLAWLSLFLDLVFGVGAAAPDLGFSLQLVPGCNELIYVMFFVSESRSIRYWGPSGYPRVSPNAIRLLCRHSRRLD